MMASIISSKTDNNRIPSEAQPNKHLIRNNRCSLPSRSDSFFNEGRKMTTAHSRTIEFVHQSVKKRRPKPEQNPAESQPSWTWGRRTRWSDLPWLKSFRSSDGVPTSADANQLIEVGFQKRNEDDAGADWPDSARSVIFVLRERQTDWRMRTVLS